ncbi:MAG: hypothetical protein K6T31_02740 [Alicyclobacillus sp.]|nr:hypothetical protein [Alicyclobacillus sp.]
MTDMDQSGQAAQPRLGMGAPLVVGRLPRVLVLLAGVNFATGAVLGAWMAADPSARPVWAAVHGELNPYGWLTLLIYGMTYAVLAVSAGLVPPWPWLGWLQAGLAEAGVWLAGAGWGCQQPLLAGLGKTLEALAASVFLLNILTAVAQRRRRLPVFNLPPELAFLSKAEAWRATDRIAQRGTDVALMFYLVAAWWQAAAAFRGQPSPAGAEVLAAFGWLAGTVLAVALHLLPRLLGRPLSARWAAWAQVLWGAGVLACTVEAVLPGARAAGQAGQAELWSGWASRGLGLAFTVWAGGYLVVMGNHRHALVERLVPAARWAWLASWGYALILGISLLSGAPLTALSVYHLLFLGWISTLVYGVGWSLFPVLFQWSVMGRARLQVGLAVAGTAGLLLGFVGSDRWPGRLTQGCLAVGGCLAAVAVLWFLLSWPLALWWSRQAAARIRA